MSNGNKNDLELQLSSSPLEIPVGSGEQTVVLRLAVQPSANLRLAARAEGGADICLVLDISGSMIIIISAHCQKTGKTVIADHNKCSACGQVLWEASGKGEAEEKQTTVVNGVNGHTLLTKLDACKAAAKPLLSLLRTADARSDTLSIVTFNQMAQVVCPPVRQSQQREFESALSKVYVPEQLSGKGDTYVGYGLCCATEPLAKGNAGNMKKIILLTDGQASDGTAGIEQARTIASMGWSIDCLGLGKDFDRMYLKELVGPALGRTEELQTPEDATRLFTECLKKTQDVVANNVRLTLTFSEHVVVADWFRGAPENTHLGKMTLPGKSRRCTVSLGSIERHQAYEYFVVVRVPPLPEATREFVIGSAEVQFDLPGRGKTDSSISQSWKLAIGTGKRPVANRKLDEAFSMTEIQLLEKQRDEAIGRKDHAAVAEILGNIARVYVICRSFLKLNRSPMRSLNTKGQKRCRRQRRSA